MTRDYHEVALEADAPGRHLRLLAYVEEPYDLIALCVGDTTAGATVLAYEFVSIYTHLQSQWAGEWKLFGTDNNHSNSDTSVHILATGHTLILMIDEQDPRSDATALHAVVATASFVEAAGEVLHYLEQARSE